MNRETETVNVDLHIERLVIEGLPVGAGQGRQVEEAVATELGRLVARGGIAPDLAEGGARPDVAGGTVRWEPGGGAGPLGRQIARAAYEGIGEAPRRDVP